MEYVMSLCEDVMRSGIQLLHELEELREDNIKLKRLAIDANNSVASLLEEISEYKDKFACILTQNQLNLEYDLEAAKRELHTQRVERRTGD
jgi:hypothetical protein